MVPRSMEQRPLTANWTTITTGTTETKTEHAEKEKDYNVRTTRTRSARESHGVRFRRGHCLLLVGRSGARGGTLLVGGRTRIILQY
jgi:hypothetical protein